MGLVNVPRGAQEELLYYGARAVVAAPVLAWASLANGQTFVTITSAGATDSRTIDAALAASTDRPTFCAALALELNTAGTTAYNWTVNGTSDGLVGTAKNYGSAYNSAPTGTALVGGAGSITTYGRDAYDQEEYFALTAKGQLITKGDASLQAVNPPAVPSVLMFDPVAQLPIWGVDHILNGYVIPADGTKFVHIPFASATYKRVEIEIEVEFMASATAAITLDHDELGTYVGSSHGVFTSGVTPIGAQCRVLQLPSYVPGQKVHMLCKLTKNLTSARWLMDSISATDGNECHFFGYIPVQGVGNELVIDAWGASYLKAGGLVTVRGYKA